MFFFFYSTQILKANLEFSLETQDALIMWHHLLLKTLLYIMSGLELITWSDRFGVTGAITLTLVVLLYSLCLRCDAFSLFSNTRSHRGSLWLWLMFWNSISLKVLFLNQMGIYFPSLTQSTNRLSLKYELMIPCCFLFLLGNTDSTRLLPWQSWSYINLFSQQIRVYWENLDCITYFTVT